MAMGELIELQQRREWRAARGVPTPAFYFDVACPTSYLAAERVERTLGQIEWVAVAGAAVRSARPSDAERLRLRDRAERDARRLQLPLVWPEPFSANGARARRAASFACELGAGAAFALAAGRLAYCGGFDLDDPETLAEAAAAAGVPLGLCLQAAGESWRDDELSAIGRAVADRGVRELPALCSAGRWFDDVTGLISAGVRLSAACSAPRPLAPVS